MASHNEAVAEFAAVLAYETGKRVDVVGALASKLIRAASSLHKRYEAECSYEWADTDEYRAATERKEAAVSKLLAPYGIGVTFNGDPRGAPIKLQLPKTRRTNDWGSEGYCVPVK